MATIVKKFGGSSVATPEKMFGIVERVLEERQPDDRIVIVVSAMGDTTDDLLELAAKVNPAMPKREMDRLLSTGEQISIALLAAAFVSRGVKAISMTGAQAGIRTNGIYTKASILDVQADRVQKALDEGNIVIVAGFQGITDSGDVTTLGRGGSDTTAVAVAAGLKADMCEIYTDVDGVFTADPRICPQARKMEEITFAEMLELARLGAGVMQPRAVEYGMHNHMPIHVRSTFHKVSGTIIREEYTVKETSFVIRGIAHDTNVAKIAVRDVPDQPGVAYKLFKALADANVNVDMIVQSARISDNTNDIVFTIAKTDLAEATAVMENLKTELGYKRVDYQVNVAKVSVVGAGMLGEPGIAAGVFGALGEAGVNIIVIGTSEINISCLIAGKDVEKAVCAIHDHFFPRQAE